MKTGKFLAMSVVGLVLPLAILQGCGGGGGGGNSSPSPTATPVAGARSLIVRLRDSSGAVVDGIVTVGTAVQATSGGQATFTGIAAGTRGVSAEVNGVTTTGNATVANTGSTTFTLTISTSVTPGPTSAPPAPPF